MQCHVQHVRGIGPMVSEVLLSQYITCLHLPPVNSKVKQACQRLQEMEENDQTLFYSTFVRNN